MLTWTNVKVKIVGNQWKHWHEIGYKLKRSHPQAFENFYSVGFLLSYTNAHELGKSANFMWENLSTKNSPNGVGKYSAMYCKKGFYFP